MREKNNIFKMQFQHMLSRVEFKISLTTVLIFVSLSFFELCGKIRGYDVSRLYSAAYGWVGHAVLLDLPVMQCFLVLLIFFVGSMAFADSQFVDGKIHARSMMITRCPRKSYILAGALVSFLGAFFVIFIPFVLSQLLSFIVFPLHGSLPYALNSPDWKLGGEVCTLFPSLFYNHPLLYNLLAIFYMSFCAGAFAVLSFCFSFFVKRGRLLIIALPTLLVLVEGFFFPGHLTFSYYLYMGGILNMKLYMYLGVPLGVLALCCLLLSVKISMLRDELI